MKICLLSRFFDLRNGGIGRFSQSLFHELEGTGHEVLKVSQDGGVPLGEGMIKYFTYTALEAPFKIPEADVYHALTPMESLHAPKPLVVTFHDLIPLLHLDKIETHYSSNRFERWLSSGYFGMACSTAVGEADAITAVSEQTRREIEKKFAGEKSYRGFVSRPPWLEEVKVKTPPAVDVVRHGIDPNLEPKEKPDSTFRIGSLGFLGPRKRNELLIKSFLEADVEGELAIAGEIHPDDPEYRRLKRAAGGDERIKFLDYVPDEELVDFYNSLDFFVLASRVEGYGLPAVEAMACRTPVVTLSDSLIPDDVKGRTTVINDLRNWFENPYSDSDLDEAYSFAKGHDWRETGDEFLKIYEGVIS